MQRSALRLRLRRFEILTKTVLKFDNLLLKYDFNIRKSIKMVSFIREIYRFYFLFHTWSTALQKSGSEINEVLFDKKSYFFYIVL